MAPFLQSHAPLDRSPVFLVGVFRSGTSLLHRLINSHPDIHLMWEADPLRFLAGKTCRHWARRLDLWNGCLSRHGIDPAHMPARTTREEAALGLYQAYGDADVTGIVGEKSPYYTQVLPRLARSFPLARFIIVHRHPAAIVQSVRKAALTNRFFRPAWMPLRVIKDAGRLRKHAAKLRCAGHPVFEIEFEDLVQNPAAHLRTIWEWLGVDPDPPQLENPGSRHIPEGEHHHMAIGHAVDRRRGQDAPPCSMLDRYRLLRPELRTCPASAARLDSGDALMLLRDEILYHAINQLELGKRLVFRNAPLPFLRRHRERSGHPVGPSSGEA